MCCSPWGLKESDKTERLKNNNTGLILLVILYIAANTMQGKGLTFKVRTRAESGPNFQSLRTQEVTFLCPVSI